MKRGSFALFAVGMLGVLALPLTLTPLLAAKPLALPPGAPMVPLGILVALSLLNPTLFLLLGVFAGARCAAAVGLHSVIGRSFESGLPVSQRLRPHVRFGLLSGVLLALTLSVADAAFFILGGSEPHVFDSLPAEVRPGTPRATIVGILYGGITEEIMLRWGAMSFVVWLTHRVTGLTPASNNGLAVWVGIIVAALVFASGHLPEVASLVPLTASTVMRTLALNGGAGVLLGWIYWKRGLEIAMLTHATSNVGLALVAVLRG